MIKAVLTDNLINSTSSDAFTLYEKSSYGDKRANKIEYSPVEALFLFQENKMALFHKNKEIDEDSLLNKLKKIDKKIELKLIVYRDLRKKGYILKSALKFGTEFRVYEKGIKPGEEHAKWILAIVKDSDNVNWHDFAAKNRIAHSTRKSLLLAIIDSEGSVSYYECEWKRP